jgi:hypothetical protein
MAQSIPAIIYKSPRSGNERKIVVLNGLPYYESTGQSSGAAKTWFPFIMITGKKPIETKDLPKKIGNTINTFTIFGAENVMVKYGTECVDTPDLSKEIYEGRIPTKQILIVSSQLNPQGHKRSTLVSAGLSNNEISQAQDALVIQELNVEIIEDTDKVNIWLIKHGAKIVTDIFSDAFADQLRNKYHYYYERAKTFQTEGLEEKRDLYHSLGKIFEDEHDIYLDKIDSKIEARTNCLITITNQVQQLETTLEINEGRNIFAQILRMIKAIAVDFGLCQPDSPVKEKFKIAGNMHRFGGHSTQTVKDLAEVVDQEILSINLS